jgi:hypothetical protein
MIYRNGAVIYSPVVHHSLDASESPKETGQYTAHKFSSVNAAKREVREKRLTVRCGKPPKDVQS